MEGGRPWAGGAPEVVVLLPPARGRLHRRTWAGHVAEVVCLRDKAIGLAHTHAPVWMFQPGPHDCRIFELGMLAGALGVIHAVSLAPNAPIVARCDNMGSIGTVVRGTCQAPRAVPSHHLFGWSLLKTRPTFVPSLRIRIATWRMGRRAVVRMSFLLMILRD